jgi:hypothetical protein
VACIEDRKGAYRILMEKPVGKRPLRRPRPGWQDNIKTDLQEVGWETWNGLIWLRIGTDGRYLCMR